MEEQGVNKKIILTVTLVAIFLIFYAFLRFGVFPKSEKKERVEVTTKTAPTKAFQKGSLRLNTAKQTSFFLNQPLTIQLLADSAGDEVVGFDILITYDENAFDFVKATSLLSDFKLYFFKKKGYLILTSVKDLKSNQASIFKQTPVLDLTFLPKTSGDFTFAIKEKIGKETTGLVNNRTERFTPQLIDLKLKIK